MKKVIAILLAMVLCLGLFAGCGPKESDGKTIDTLVVGFVPSREADEIVTATEPLKEMLKAELAKSGYTVNNVEITVGTSFEAVGEGLDAGTIDIGLIPGSTYVLYDDGAEVVLTATRDALSKDSTEAKDWNDGLPTLPMTTDAVGYRSLIIAGPSEVGQALAAKVNAGESLTWDDINSAKWGVSSSTSPAGYVYPTIWLQENFDKKITDLNTAVQTGNYSDSFGRLAAGQLDVIVCYADARRDNATKWTTDFGRTTDIFVETNVIGVTPHIYNDTISISRNAETYSAEFKKAVQDAFINIASTEAGKEVISIYQHKGYVVAVDSDYDNERKAQELMKN